MENKERNRAIVSMRRNGESYGSIANKYRLTKKRVWEIVNRDWSRYGELEYHELRDRGAERRRLTSL